MFPLAIRERVPPAQLGWYLITVIVDKQRILDITEDDDIAPYDDHAGHHVGHDDQAPDQGHVRVGAAHVVNSPRHQVSLTVAHKQSGAELCQAQNKLRIVWLL